MSVTELTVSNKTVVRVVLIALGSVLAVQLLGQLRTQVIWVLTAVFLALALEPAVSRLSRYMPRKSRGLAVLVVLLGALGLVLFVILALVPPFATQAYHLVTNLPEAYSDFTKTNPQIAQFITDNIDTADVNKALEQASQQLLSVGGSAVGILAGIFGGIVSAGTVLLLTFFMVLEGPRWVEVFWRYQPAKRRHNYQELVVQMHRTVTGYVTGNLVTSLIATLAAGGMLLVIGAPYALALALLVGIVDLIPMVGATLAAVLVVLAVLVFNGVPDATVALIFFVVYQQLENNLLQPLVFSKAVEVSPLVTILALIIGVSVAGFIGALVAIPAAASAQILLRYYLNKKYPNADTSAKGV